MSYFLTSTGFNRPKDKFKLGTYYKSGFQNLDKLTLKNIEKNWTSQAVSTAYQRYNHMLYKNDTTLKNLENELTN